MATLDLDTVGSIAAVDVHYVDDTARAASIVFHRWDDAKPRKSHVVLMSGVAPYEPGEFYKRELPSVLGVLAHTKKCDVVIVDAYVLLDGGKPGLGWRLHREIGVPVIGVAKSEYAGAPGVPVLRGESAQPLWISAIGVDVDEAAIRVKRMHGPHRIPTLLKLVDSLARG